MGDFASSAIELLRLLLIQMPRLQELSLGSTQLMEGCWESVIECLMMYNQLTSLVIDHYTTLYHHGDEVLECSNPKVEFYIIYGDRHPCLSDDQPTSASAAYMLNLDASFRNRLLEVKRPRARVPAPALTSRSTTPPLHEAITSSASSVTASRAI